MSGGSDESACPTLKNCFCEELQKTKSIYDLNISDPDNPNYTNHVTYSTAAVYIAHVLNEAQGLPVSLPPPGQTEITEWQVSSWLYNCDHTENTDPEVSQGQDPTPVPPAIDCNPPRPCPDYEDAYDIADFWAHEKHDQLLADATEKFINDYKDHCLHGPLFTEKMSAVHNDREYHYTLYYYDQAGNLTNTVPPAGVVMLSSAEQTQMQTYRNGGANPNLFPLGDGNHHRLVTNYCYNSLNESIEQKTPDAGVATFTYDNVGRIIQSQNAKQKQNSSASQHSYHYIVSYTLYDGQGRITEVGEKDVYGGQDAEGTWTETTVKSQITKTFYDTPINPSSPDVNVQALFAKGAGQQNLRQRVASTTFEQVDDGNDLTYDHATHYSYDIHGNVNELVQENPSLAPLSQQYKKIDYEYDLVSSNVNAVHYQDGKPDQFHHKYQYDADNRITHAFTSKDKITWDNDARYFYYLHGPLARTEIGDRNIQGLDYAYTIQGWIKGVNSNRLAAANSANLYALNPDIGSDAVNMDGAYGSYISTKPNLHSQFAADAYGYTLGYFNDGQGGAGANDYRPIKSSALSLLTDVKNQNVAGDNLFNGNIKQMATALMQPNSGVLPTAMPLIAIFPKPAPGTPRTLLASARPSSPTRSIPSS